MRFLLHSLRAHFYDARAAARFRSLDGAICIPSRYLATVRLATGMPSCDRISASLLSLHGFSGLSCEINFLILARIAVDDISVPSAAATWLEKKYRNSNTPRGVCMYLAVVTREIVDSCISTASATSLRMSGTIASSPSSKKLEIG